jgi:hypothetical protein
VPDHAAEVIRGNGRAAARAGAGSR